jgi:hypothetical protein
MPNIPRQPDPEDTLRLILETMQFQGDFGNVLKSFDLESNPTHVILTIGPLKTGAAATPPPAPSNPSSGSP